MSQNFSILTTKKIAIVIGFTAILFFVFSKSTGEKVEISKSTCKIINGEYLVSFLVRNKSNKRLYTKLSIMLHHRNFAGGSAKAEVLDLVGKKSISISLNPSESKQFDEIVKPKTFAFKVDKVTINTLGH